MADILSDILILIIFGTCKLFGPVNISQTLTGNIGQLDPTSLMDHATRRHRGIHRFNLLS